MLEIKNIDKLKNMVLSVKTDDISSGLWTIFNIVQHVGYYDIFCRLICGTDNINEPQATAKIYLHRTEAFNGAYKVECIKSHSGTIVRSMLVINHSFMQSMEDFIMHVIQTMLLNK